MHRRPHRAVLTAATLAAGLALALTACVGTAPTSTPDAASAPPTATPTPTPEPVDPLTTVTALVARPEALELRDAGGAVVGSLDYLAPVGPAIDTLSTVFGAPPVDEEHRGTSHFPPTVVHRWDGFELWENRYVDNWAEFADDPRTLYQPSFGVVFTEPGRGSIALTTSHGVEAGTAWTELEAMPGLQVNPSGCSGPYLDYIERDETWPDGTVHVKRFGVDFIDRDNWSAPIVVTEVRAPMPIHEDGCA